MKAKEVWNKFKEYNNIFDLKKTGYIFKKSIFWSAMIICILFVSYVAWTNNFDFSYKYYAKCPMVENIDVVGSTCINTLYNNPKCKEDWCYEERLDYGVEYGTSPDPLIKHGKNFILLIFFFAFALNHLLYNKAFKFEVKV